MGAEAVSRIGPAMQATSPVGMEGDQEDIVRAVPTIEDVARSAGVSPATVSRVLNDRPIVRAETRQRVLTAIAQLQFQPNSLGRSLATSRTGALGLVVTDITNPFHPQIVRGVELAATAARMSVLLYDTAEDEEREVQALRLLSERQVDGLVICSSRLPRERIATLARAGKPLVLINRLPIPGCVGTVETDQEEGIRQAVLHLVGLGHRRIAYVGGPAASEAQQRRLGAFRTICGELGLALPEEDMFSAPASIEGGREYGHLLLERTRPADDSALAPPTAIVAYDDTVAVGVLLAARDLGLQVPGQLSIVGYDDVPLAAVVSPALTTIQQPMHELGERAVRMLHSFLQARRTQRKPPVDPILVRLEPHLIVRASTAHVGPVEGQGN